MLSTWENILVVCTLCVSIIKSIYYLANFVQLSMYTTIIISGWRHIAVGSFI